MSLCAENESSRLSNDITSAALQLLCIAPQSMSKCIKSASQRCAECARNGCSSSAPDHDALIGAPLTKGTADQLAAAAAKPLLAVSFRAKSVELRLVALISRDAIDPLAEVGAHSITSVRRRADGTTFEP